MYAVPLALRGGFLIRKSYCRSLEAVTLQGTGPWATSSRLDPALAALAAKANAVNTISPTKIPVFIFVSPFPRPPVDHGPHVRGRLFPRAFPLGPARDIRSFSLAFPHPMGVNPLEGVEATNPRSRRRSRHGVPVGILGRVLGRESSPLPEPPVDADLCRRHRGAHKPARQKSYQAVGALAVRFA